MLQRARHGRQRMGKGSYKCWAVVDVWAQKKREEGRRWLGRARNRKEQKYVTKVFDLKDEAECWAEQKYLALEGALPTSMKPDRFDPISNWMGESVPRNSFDEWRDRMHYIMEEGKTHAKEIVESIKQGRSNSRGSMLRKGLLPIQLTENDINEREQSLLMHWYKVAREKQYSGKSGRKKEIAVYLWKLIQEARGDTSYFLFDRGLQGKEKSGFIENDFSQLGFEGYWVYLMIMTSAEENYLVKYEKIKAERYEAGKGINNEEKKQRLLRESNCLENELEKKWPKGCDGVDMVKHQHRMLFRWLVEHYVYLFLIESKEHETHRMLTYFCDHLWKLKLFDHSIEAYRCDNS